MKVHSIISGAHINEEFPEICLKDMPSAGATILEDHPHWKNKV